MKTQILNHQIPKQPCEWSQLTMLSCVVHVAVPAVTEWINIYVTRELLLRETTAVKICCHGNHATNRNIE